MLSLSGWSGRRGSNSLPPPWQGGALPDELRPHFLTKYNPHTVRFVRLPANLRFTRLTTLSDKTRFVGYHVGVDMESANSTWCLRSESNQRHADFQSAALPTELQRHVSGKQRCPMATQNGLEPSASSVTGWRSNQLNYWALSSQTPLSLAPTQASGLACFVAPTLRRKPVAPDSALGKARNGGGNNWA